MPLITQALYGCSELGGGGEQLSGRSVVLITQILYECSNPGKCDNNNTMVVNSFLLEL